jgi:hypothetical protein
LATAFQALDSNLSLARIVSTKSNLLTHIRIYTLAEKYDIPALKDLAKSKFGMAIACYYNSPEFADAIEEVYRLSIDDYRGLRTLDSLAPRTYLALSSALRL